MTELIINGKRHLVDIESDTPLLWAIRDTVGLTGTKYGCGIQQCGACTVLIGDVNHYSCTILTHRIRDRDVTTVEGLEGSSGELHPVQQAFIDELSPQCGFCTPGFLVVISALLEENPQPDDDAIKCAIEGNLCRCTGYHNIVKAVQAGAAAMKG